MDAMRLTAGALGVVAAVCLALVQFLPWGGIAEGGDSFSFRGTAYTWEMEMAFDAGSFGGQSDSGSWYSDEVENDDGEASSEVRNIRAAIPMLVAALALATVGGIVAFLMRGNVPGILLLAAGVASTVATVLFAVAVHGLFDGDQDWGASFYLALVASAFTLIGGVLGLLPRKGAAAPSPQ